MCRLQLFESVESFLAGAGAGIGIGFLIALGISEKWFAPLMALLLVSASIMASRLGLKLSPSSRDPSKEPDDNKENPSREE